VSVFSGRFGEEKFQVSIRRPSHPRPVPHRLQVLLRRQGGTHSHTSLLGIPDEKQDHMEMVAVCDAKGNILWAHTADIEVIEMDGRSPADLLPKHDVTPAE